MVFVLEHRHSEATDPWAPIRLRYAAIGNAYERQSNRPDPLRARKPLFLEMPPQQLDQQHAQGFTGAR
jgi:hypothetical protein